MDRPLRIVVLTQYFWPEVGAAQTRLAALVNVLSDNGHTVQVVTSMPNYPTGRIFDGYRRRLVSTESFGSATVRRSWVYAASGTGWRRLLNYLSFTTSSVIGLARSGKADLMFIESPPLFLAVPGLLYARLRNIRTVFNVADLWPDAAVAVGALNEGRTLRAMYRLERWIYRTSDVVTTVTDGVVGRLRNKGVDESKLVMLPNGVDTSVFRPDRADPVVLRRLGLESTAFVIYAGTMGLAHGIDPLIEAMELLRETPDAPTLVMLGNGSERDRLRSVAHDKGLTNVLFFDAIPIDDLAGLLPYALAGVVTAAPIELNQSSRPAKLFPLMAAGLPIVHAGPGGGAEAVLDGGAGIAVDNEAGLIADALLTVVRDAEARSRWGASARSAVDPAWSWDQLVLRWLDEVTSVTDRSEGPSSISRR